MFNTVLCDAMPEYIDHSLNWKSYGTFVTGRAMKWFLMQFTIYDRLILLTKKHIMFCVSIAYIFIWNNLLGGFGYFFDEEALLTYKYTIF